MPFQQLNSQLVTVHPLSHRLNDEKRISYTGSLLLFKKYAFSIFAYYFGKLFADTKQKLKTYFSIHIHKKLIIIILF
jgi:hypothetical protein